jgi:hypothetical protein
MFAHRDRQGAEMILMRVGENNRIHRVIRDEFETGESIRAGFFRMKPRIKQNTLAAVFEEIAIGADFDGPGEVGKADGTHVGAGC